MPASRADSVIRRLFSRTFEIVAWTAKSRPTSFGAFTRETTLAIGPACRAELIKVEGVAVGKMHRFGEARDE